MGCYFPRYVNIRRRTFTDTDSYHYINECEVGCGKCAGCLKSRQNLISTRALINSEVYPNMYFITLTYKESMLPISRVSFAIDTDSGEMSVEGSLSVISRKSEEYQPVLEELLALPTTKEGRTVFYEYNTKQFDDCVHRVCYSQSLNYSDVQKYFKRIRRRLEYRAGKTVEMSYLICGEYGPQTSRPHYHVLLFFKEPLDVEGQFILRDCWSYGFTLCKNVNSSPKSRLNVSQYIAKYMVKGDYFESDCVLLGFSVKPRIHASINFGAFVPKNLLDYYKCFDLFGPYEINDPYKHLTDEQVKKICEVMFDRLRYTVDKYLYPLPGLTKRKLFGYSFNDGVFYWSKIYVLARDAARDRIFARRREEFLSFCSANGLSEDSIEAMSCYEEHLRILGEADNKASFQSLRKFYLKSKYR